MSHHHRARVSHHWLFVNRTTTGDDDKPHQRSISSAPPGECGCCALAFLIGKILFKVLFPRKRLKLPNIRSPCLIMNSHPCLKQRIFIAKPMTYLHKTSRCLTTVFGGGMMGQGSVGIVQMSQPTLSESVTQNERSHDYHW